MYQEPSIRQVFFQETDVPEVYRDTQWPLRMANDGVDWIWFRDGFLEVTDVPEVYRGPYFVGDPRGPKALESRAIFSCFSLGRSLIFIWYGQGALIVRSETLHRCFNPKQIVDETRVLKAYQAQSL